MLMDNGQLLIENISSIYCSRQALILILRVIFSGHLLDRSLKINKGIFSEVCIDFGKVKNFEPPKPINFWS